MLIEKRAFNDGVSYPFLPRNVLMYPLLFACMLIVLEPTSMLCVAFTTTSVSSPRLGTFRRDASNSDSATTTTGPESIGTSSDNASTNAVEKCYDAWNRRDFDEVLSCFDDNAFEYEDSAYLGTMTNKKDLMKYFTQTSNGILPTDCKVVLDHIAVDTDNGKIGAEWHVEKTDGNNVPFTRGCSFYNVDATTNLITRGFKVTEMLVKPNKGLVDGMISSLTSSGLPMPFSSSTANTSNESYNRSNDDQSMPSSQSIIELYFKAWNERDMERALDCFVEDCTYQTEDPVFVDTFQGKDALREHLVKNAKALPASCQIILDDIANDTQNHNTIGTKWHLEVNGFAIPNLRGCSMYTKDPETGLLKTGFDVTEAPIKLPRESIPFVSLPAKFLLFGSS